MPKSQSHPVTAFFASVQLALVLLFLLAATSIIGTIIPQNQPPQFYFDQYGATAARFIHVLDIPVMYSSWWFLTLLVLFSINLIVCSVKRIPQVIAIIRKDNLNTTPERLKKMTFSQEVSLRGIPDPDTVSTLFRQNGWRTTQQKKPGGILFFAQKGAWTRFGVYVVHLSILVILTGALLGSSMFAEKVLHNPNFAFKGSMAIQEGQYNDTVFASGSGHAIPLGFSVLCTAFTVDFYPNGMPRLYLSQVTVLEDGKPVAGKENVDVKVNHPLQHKGITLYQSAYRGLQRFSVTIEKKNKAKQTTAKHQDVILPAKEQAWREAGISYGIINHQIVGNDIRSVKIWFYDGQGQADTFWVDLGKKAVLERPTGTYTFQSKQIYATILQVTKDPGVWIVYTGCMLMLAGLSIAFFTAHRKIFAYLKVEKNRASLLIAGTSNKNTAGFEKTCQQLIKNFEAEQSLHG